VVKKNRLILLIIAISCIALDAYGAELADVKGWQNTYWGMSPQELEAAYGNQLNKETNPDGTVTYTIKNFSLFAETLFEVQFFWRDGVHLSKVIISPESLYEKVDLTGLAEQILSSLKGKYGEGRTVKSESSPSSNVIIGNKKFFTMGSKFVQIHWSYPSTLIEYRFHKFEYAQSRYESSIMLIYQENEQSKL